LQPEAAAMAAGVSIVIPCFNQAQFLGEAIESALAQSCRPCQVIVVDDGATDSTAEVASMYRDVRLLRQPNRGRPVARNVGLGASEGDHVIFLDADDRLLPGAATVGAAALDARPEAAFAVGRYGRIAADGTPLPGPVRPRVAAEHYVSLVRRCWIAMPAAVTFRRSALVAVGGFDGRLRVAEDYELYLRISRRFAVVDHGIEVAEYRQHPGTASRDYERMLEATLAVLDGHRPPPGATAALREAWQARENAAWYFEQLLGAAGDDLAAHHWRSAARRLATFARHLPRHPGYARDRLRGLARRALGRPAAA
jgi:glycosyltransferase involved in cell wall biosynthesis